MNTTASSRDIAAEIRCGLPTRCRTSIGNDVLRSNLIAATPRSVTKPAGRQHMRDYMPILRTGSSTWHWASTSSGLARGCFSLLSEC
jgi:hypothetical protein